MPDGAIGDWSGGVSTVFCGSTASGEGAFVFDAGLGEVGFGLGDGFLGGRLIGVEMLEASEVGLGLVDGGFDSVGALFVGCRLGWAGGCG